MLEHAERPVLPAFRPVAAGEHAARAEPARQVLAPNGVGHRGPVGITVRARLAAFGALMNMYQWTLAAEHTLPSYLAVSGTSLAFNLLHAGGNVVFALILGPAFIRSLERYRRRFEVRWLATAPRAVAGGAAALLAALLLAVPGQTASA